MKEYIYNKGNLLDSDINNVITRMKVLLIKNNNIILGKKEVFINFLVGI